MGIVNKSRLFRGIDRFSGEFFTTHDGACLPASLTIEALAHESNIPWQNLLTQLLNYLQANPSEHSNELIAYLQSTPKHRILYDMQFENHIANKIPNVFDLILKSSLTSPVHTVYKSFMTDIDRIALSYVKTPQDMRESYQWASLGEAVRGEIEKNNLETLRADLINYMLKQEGATDEDINYLLDANENDLLADLSSIDSRFSRILVKLINGSIHKEANLEESMKLDLHRRADSSPWLPKIGYSLGHSVVQSVLESIFPGIKIVCHNVSWDSKKSAINALDNKNVANSENVTLELGHCENYYNPCNYSRISKLLGEAAKEVSKNPPGSGLH